MPALYAVILDSNHVYYCIQTKVVVELKDDIHEYIPIFTTFAFVIFFSLYFAVDAERMKFVNNTAKCLDLGLECRGLWS